MHVIARVVSLKNFVSALEANLSAFGMGQRDRREWQRLEREAEDSVEVVGTEEGAMKREIRDCSRKVKRKLKFFWRNEKENKF
ncbi:hypothetical protein ACSQ67_026355 [Phaseolus vulgaris]